MGTALKQRTWNLTLAADRPLILGERPLVMGVLNLTPDSFSDGGQWASPDSAVEAALEMERQGVHLLDLGAESTRPGGGVYGSGARAVPVAEELDRLLPVLEALRPLTRLPISVDTRKGVVAREALGAGANLINDVSALTDPEMISVVAESGCPVVLMHNRGSLGTMQRNLEYGDLLGEVIEMLTGALERAERGGVARSQTILDPGIGFGKSLAQNLTLLRELHFLESLERPILVGASRKSFIGHITGKPAPYRLGGSLAAAAWAASRGAAILRVHDVSATVELLDVWQAIEGDLEDSA
jgi:dihydropteroate synthase